MTHHKGPAYDCPSCGASIDCHHCVTRDVVYPVKDDILVCAHCRAVLEVLDPLSCITRVLSTEDLLKLPDYIQASLSRVMNDWENQKRKTLEG